MGELCNASFEEKSDLVNEMHALEIFKARCLIKGMLAKAIGESRCCCPYGLWGGYLSVQGT